MSNYREHIREYIEYLDAQAVLNEVVDAYDAAFQRTQPHSPCYYGVKTDSRKNRVEEFVIEVESKDLKRRIEDAQMILNLKTEMLKLKESELRKSADVYDTVYVAKWIDHKTVNEITRKLGYSQSQVYEIIKRIKKDVPQLS